MRVCARLGCSAAGDRLGDAEVDDLRHRPAVEIRDEQVAGLQVAVDDAFLMRVLNGVADLQEQREALIDAEPMPVAVLGERDAAHVFHREIRPAAHPWCRHR